ncbi:GIY-YIG nuclease family protein [Candidatus Gottesmanbacteria bacterium]|nr:GIY-YIG nuclease family protein [Candidatus Gottesmanbacteria bacterium]MBI5452294.1 GIY-YIG nuclease family protein [Candidatus Gottesmanbacteria bacterium]
MIRKIYYVYFLKNKTGNLYIGVTNNLERRLWEHENKVADSFTGKYNIDKLVYYEIYSDPITAIAREKQLKNWSRRKKIELILRSNPKFQELRI